MRRRRRPLTPGDHLFITALLAVAGTDDFYPPAALFSIAGVHAEQITGKNRRFIATGARPHFQKHATAIVGVLGDQQALQLDVQLCQLFAAIADFHFRQLAHLRITVTAQLFGLGDAVFDPTVTLPGGHQLFQLSVFTRIVTEALLIVDHLGIGQQHGQLLETVGEAIQALAQSLFHAGVSSFWRFTGGAACSKAGLGGSNRRGAALSNSWFSCEAASRMASVG